MFTLEKYSNDPMGQSNCIVDHSYKNLCTLHDHTVHTANSYKTENEKMVLKMKEIVS